MLCAQFKPIIALFYDIMHIWTIEWVLFVDKHMQICIPTNFDLAYGLVLIFLCGLLPVSNVTDFFKLLQTKVSLS